MCRTFLDRRATTAPEGAHSFYRGPTARGVGHVVISVLVVALFIGASVTAVTNADAQGYLTEADTLA